MRTKKILYAPDLMGKLSDATLLIDSTALIDATNQSIFMDFLIGISESGCTMITVPSVLYEFKRGAKDLERANYFDEVIQGLGIVPISKIENLALDPKNQVFTVMYNSMALGSRTERGPSYTDSLLCLAMYVYRHSKILLLTSNYKDVPLDLFSREDLIVYDTGKDVRTAAIYSLSEDKLSRQLDKRLAQKKKKV